MYVDLYIDKIIRLIPNKGNVIYNLLSSVLKEIISTSTSVKEIDLISNNSLRTEVASSCLQILKIYAKLIVWKLINLSATRILSEIKFDSRIAILKSGLGPEF